MLGLYLRIKSALLAKQQGATLVEYGLLVALIAAVVIGIVVVLGQQVQQAFQTIVDAL